MKHRVFKASLAVLIVGLMFVPAAALAIYKPARVIAPQWFGVVCHDDMICIDDPAYAQRARLLVHGALKFVNANIHPIERPPRIIFCTTQACDQTFGFHHAAAYNVGTSGIVIRRKGWKKHFVRHELIHHLQNERLGLFETLIRRPEWWREGMAYSFSEDPRRPIPDPHLENMRKRFELWAKQGSIWRRP